MVSIARRLVLLMVLATAGFAIATMALFRARNETDAVRSARAFEQATAVTEVLARSPTIADSEASTNQTLAPVLAPLIDASAGYCDHEKLLAHSTVAPLFDPAMTTMPLSPPGETPDRRTSRPPPGFVGPPPANSPGLLPLDRDVVLNACTTLKGTRAQVRFAAPNDLLFVVVDPLADGRAAWALVRMPNRTAASGALPLAAGLTALLLALIAGSFATMRTLRSDSAALAEALQGIPKDLTTPVPKPTTTELAVLADGLREMTRRLGEANAREASLRARLEHESRLAGLGRVVAGVSHEIRNPLAGLKLRLDAMFRRGLDERNARDVGHALAEVDRLDRVVTSFLHVSRKSGEDSPSLATSVALHELVHERFDALRPFAAHKSVSFDAQLPTTFATIHRDSVARMLDNLLRNAIEASPHEGVITVHFHATPEGFQIRIEDRGPGVEEQHRSQLFEPFFTSKADGTGLGLSLARAAMEASDGSLSYERSGNITRFIAQFPHRSITKNS